MIRNLVVLCSPVNETIFSFFSGHDMVGMVPRSSGGETASTVIKLDTVRRIAEKVRTGMIWGEKGKVA